MSEGFWQIELPAAGDDLEAFAAVARAYVFHLGVDDLFRVQGRVTGQVTRELTWSPGQGGAVLSGLVADYREYFEGIWFPPLDDETLRASTIYGSGVGMRVLNVRGDERALHLLQDLLREPPPAGPRAGLIALYEAAWTSRAEARRAFVEALSGADPRARLAAIRLSGRYRLVDMADPLMALRDDPREAVRQTVVAALAAIDPLAAIPATVRLLADPSDAVRDAAFAVLRHAGHMPWGKRKDLMDDVMADLCPGLDRLDAARRAEVLEWLVGCASPHAVEAVAALASDGDAAVRHKAVQVLASMPAARVLPTLVEALGDAEEAVAVAAVEALGTESMQAALRARPDLLEIVMQRLAGLSSSPPA